MTLAAVIFVALGVVFCCGVFYLARRILKSVEREEE
jgi:hypothetical protein